MEPASVQFPLFAAVPFAAGVICSSLAFAILSRDPRDYGELPLILCSPQQLKQVGQGTGLDLSISHEIIRGHGDEIVVEAKTEAGARFALTLPLSDGPDPDA